MLENLRSRALIKPSPFERRRARLAYTSLSRIVMAAEVIPTEKPVDKFYFQPSRELSKLQREVHKVYGYGKEARTQVPRSRVAIAKTAGAAALYYGTAHFLEYRAHRFTFHEDERQLSYSRMPFNIDCQSLGSRMLHLTGLPAIAAEPQALQELTWLAAQLEDTKPDEWGGNHLENRLTISS